MFSGGQRKGALETNGLRRRLLVILKMFEREEVHKQHNHTLQRTISV